MKAKTVGVIQAREEIAVTVEGEHIYVTASFLDAAPSTIRIPVDSTEALIGLLSAAVRASKEDA